MVKIQTIEGSELFIGLVGALGCNLPFVEQELQKLLGGLRYTSYVIKFTDVLYDYNDKYKVAKDLPRDERIEKLMDAGDQVREDKKDGSAMAILGLMKIHKLRQAEKAKTTKGQQDQNTPLQRTAYIFHSLKHPDEAKVLRALYGDKFVLIAVFNSKNERRKAY